MIIRVGYWPIELISWLDAGPSALADVNDVIATYDQEALPSAVHCFLITFTPRKAWPKWRNQWHNVLYVIYPYMSTLPDSAGVSRIFNKILQNSCIDNFSRQERSFSRNFTITSRREIALDTVVFHTFRQSASCFLGLVKGSDHRSRLSKQNTCCII